MLECPTPTFDGEQSVESDMQDDTESEGIVIHPPASLPLPYGIEEKQDEVIFIDPSSGEGKRILSDPETSSSELFSLLRQFISPVCGNVGLIIDEMLERNIGPNDIDATTGMSALHYVIRAESIASGKSAPVQALRTLMSAGGDMSQRSLFMNMNALHFAAYFNATKSIEVMLADCGKEDMESLLDSVCEEFDFGSALHIAASNLCASAAEKLVQHGANIHLRDDKGRLPRSCIPRKLRSDDEKKSADRLKLLLQSSGNGVDKKLTKNVTLKKSSPKLLKTEGHEKTLNKLDNCNFSVGDAVFVAGSKRGVIRFMGPTEFASGPWCGIELDEPAGRNDGSINGVRYFTCDQTRGVFAPPDKLIIAPKNESGEKQNFRHTVSSSGNKWRQVPPNLKENERSVQFNEGVEVTKKDSKLCAAKVSELKIGVIVYLDHLKEFGKVRYIGETDFATGIWIGLSLQHPVGKNNGTVKGRQYFKCRSLYGIMVRPSKISMNGVNGIDLLQK